MATNIDSQNASTEADLIAANEKIAKLEKKILKQEKINNALMKRVEAGVDDMHGNAFALFSTASSLEMEVRERTLELQSAMREIKHTNSRLEETLNELEESQYRLVQSEKLAALGQLIAGIAHEINTPLGVIRASIQNVARSTNEIIEKNLSQISAYTNAELQAFFSIISSANTKTSSLSSKEARRIRRGIGKQLDAANIEKSDDIADIFVDIGIHDSNTVSQLITHFQETDYAQIINNAHHFLTLQLNAKHIDLSVERASKVVFALKTFAYQNSSGEKVVSDINAEIETVLTLYSNQIKQGVELQLDLNTLPPLLCFADELNQVWTNLIFNALQAMNNRGTLSITTKYEANTVFISIGDSGAGIPEAVQPKIFDTFFTTKKSGEGTGLGLSIVQDIIEKHQGKISFESQPGETVFTVSLPVEKSEE